MGTVFSKSKLRALDKLIARKRELQSQLANGNPDEVVRAQRDLKRLDARGKSFAAYRLA